MLIGPGLSSNILYHALAEEFPIDAVICEQPVPTSVLLKRRIKKLGLRTVVGQVLFVGAVLPIVRFRSRRRSQQIVAQNKLNISGIPHERIVNVDSVNSPTTIATLQRLSPRVVVVNGTRIISETVLNAVKAMFINTHVGITPLYRGVHGGYWALVSRDPEHCGVTIHQVDRGIDTGSIIAQACIHPTADDTFATYPLLQFARAIPLLKQAVSDAMKGSLIPIQSPPGASRLWSHPTVWQYLRGLAVLGVR
jgi:methionyl-tRNA formyltransferase